MPLNEPLQSSNQTPESSAPKRIKNTDKMQTETKEAKP